MKQIGSVEILRLRIYPEVPGDPDSASVAIQPGIFPLMRAGDRIWWPMRGVVSTRADVSTERIGDGLFLMTPAHDQLSDNERSITTRTWTPAEFAEFLTEWGCVEGPEQRLRIRLFAGALGAS